MDALLYLLFMFAAFWVIVALILTGYGFVTALLWCLRWLVNKMNGKNNHERQDGPG